MMSNVWLINYFRTAKGEFDKTNKTSKSWTVQRNLRCDHSNESSRRVLSNGGVHIVVEQSSCFCQFYVEFDDRNKGCLWNPHSMWGAFKQFLIIHWTPANAKKYAFVIKAEIIALRELRPKQNLLFLSFFNDVSGIQEVLK